MIGIVAPTRSGYGGRGVYRRSVTDDVVRGELVHGDGGPDELPVAGPDEAVLAVVGRGCSGRGGRGLSLKINMTYSFVAN